MRCVWKLLVLLVVLPAFTLGCGAASYDDNVTQEELAAEAEQDNAEEEADSEGDGGDDEGEGAESEESEDE